MRAHELAKELGVSTKELIETLHSIGVDVKSHMSAIDPVAVELLREHYGKGSTPKPQKKEEVRPPSHTEAEAGGRSQQPSTKSDALDVSGKTITVRGHIIVREMAQALGIKPNQLITELMSLNVLASINERIDITTARRIAEKHGFTLRIEKKEHAPVPQYLKEEKEEIDLPEQLVPRPPVVTFLGHVDHGKTSLLDKIRNTSIAKSEYGGITQHIGAYVVDVDGRSITFLDTPGHAAFTAMRARGATLTDIAVIVVAADDGVMPQTIEAIKHAKAANVTIMVAINKMDLPNANPHKVKQQLQEEGLVPEEWGGNTIFVEVSALTGAGIPNLLEMILLQAEMLDLKANPNRKATGYVIEAQLEPGTGPTANLLVTNGTLHVGNIIVCGQYWGRVRALINDRGIKVKSAGPSTPVKCLGLSGVPSAGCPFKVYDNEKTARAVAEKVEEELRAKQTVAPVRKASLETLFAQLEATKKPELNIVLKCDTQGSVEAIKYALENIKNEQISLKILYAAPGNITANDVMLASASNAVIIGFQVGREPGVDTLARKEGVEIRIHNIIFELVEEVEKALKGLLTPKTKETITGHAVIKQIFPIGKDGRVAGCLVTDGCVKNKFRVRVKRGDEVLFEGRIASLKRFQETVDTVPQGLECGIRIDGFTGFSVNDILEFYEIEEIKPEF
jgi:translation initiation factor IF-2